MIDAGVGLAGLAVSSFVSATILPGASEVVLWALVRDQPALFWPAIAVATIANTAGGMTSYLIGRLVPPRDLPRGIAWVRRWGVVALLASWLPVVGDALCVGAGWLRLPAPLATVCIGLGKFARYLVVAAFA